MLLHSPTFARGWNGLLGAERGELSLSPRLREIAICAVAALTGAEYEFTHHCYDHFSSGVSCFKIPDRFGGLAQWIPSIDNRYDVACFKQLFQKSQIFLVWPCYHVTHFLTPSHRKQGSQEHGLK